MGQNKEQLKNDIKGGLRDLATLKDEIRVRLHLASMDLKDEWKKLEPRLHEVEQAAEKVSEATRAALHDAVDRLKKLRSRLN